MDTRFLESFVTVVESQSLADAARKLNLTSAALSLRIKALENEVGYALVTRTGRTVSPTASGRTLAARAKNFLADLRDFKTIGSERLLKGELRLGVASSAVAGPLCKLLLGLSDGYPEIELSVTKGSSSDLYRSLTNTDLDVALIYKPQFELPKSLKWRSVLREPYIVIAANALAERDPHELLRTEAFIRYDRTLWSGQLADEYLRTTGIEPRELMELDGLEAIAVLVDRGLGVSLVPNWSAPWPEGLSLAKLSLPDGAPIRDLGLLWHKGSSRVHLIEAVAEML